MKMEFHFLLIIFLLVLLEAVYMGQATFVQNIYKKAEPGQNITGKIGTELTAKSIIECSRK